MKNEVDTTGNAEREAWEEARTRGERLAIEREQQLLDRIAYRCINQPRIVAAWIVDLLSPEQIAKLIAEVNAA